MNNTTYRRMFLLCLGQERRKYKRREELYMAGVRVKQYEGHEMGSTDWDSVILKDLSTGGMLFIYNKNLGLGTLLDLKFDVSKATPTINCVGKIIRIENLFPFLFLILQQNLQKLAKKKKK